MYTCVNKLTSQQIHEFLLETEDLFATPLNKKISLKNYANKLQKKAEISALKLKNKIVAMVAGYNNTTTNISYISIMAVTKECSNNGYAQIVLKNFIKNARSKKMSCIHVYTQRFNPILRHLYHKYGFRELSFEAEVADKSIVHLIKYFNKNILITSLGSFSADCILKSLKNWECRLVGCDMYDKRYVANSLNVDQFYQVPTVLNELQFHNQIINICKKEKITHIFPLTDLDVDYFNKFRDYYESQFITLCMSNSTTIETCRNKLKQQNIIKKINNVKHIPTKLITDNSNKPFKYPFVCKVNNGRSSEGLLYINNTRDWNSFIQTSYKNYIVQPKIDGEIITVDIVRQLDGKQIAAIPRKELLRTHNGAGLSVKTFNDNKLMSICKIIAKEFNIYGCVNFEFIKNNNDYYFLECNPRFSAGIAFSVLNGYDVVKNHLRCFEHEPIDKQIYVKSNYYSRKYKEYKMSK